MPEFCPVHNDSRDICTCPGKVAGSQSDPGNQFSRPRRPSQDVVDRVTGCPVNVKCAGCQRCW